jgi:hypothetical protein
LIGYCFQIRLLSREALPDGLQSSCALLQHSCVLLQNGSIFLQRSCILLLSRLNILHVALTAGSGIGTEAVSRGKAKLLKFGRAILNSGEANMATAPMTAKANVDTTIAGIRLDRLFSATGSLSSCVSLFSASACGSFSGVSATCVRLGSMGQSRSVDDPATALLRDCPPKTNLDHGLI